MKTHRPFLTLLLLTLVGAATTLAQGPAIPPAGTPAGGPNTGSTNSGGAAAPGRPATTPTGPTMGGTGSGTTPVTPPAAITPGGPVTPPGGPPSATPANPTTPPRIGVTTGSNTGTTNLPGNPGKANPAAVNDHASDNAKAVQDALKQFDAQRNQIAAERKALIEKLTATKTEAERKEILEQLRTEQKEQADEQRALAKQIREELKKVRDQQRGGGS